MNYRTQLDTQWNRLLDEAAAGGTLTASTGEGDLHCQLSEVNPLACQLDRLSYFSERIAGADAATLERLAREFARRATYLLEPLELIEIDRESAGVLLRSSPPAADGDAIHYFEAAITRDRGFHLQRFAAPRGQARQPLPAALTREVVYRLADDMVAASESLDKGKK